jgi:hypothetical protein
MWLGMGWLILFFGEMSLLEFFLLDLCGVEGVVFLVLLDVVCGDEVDQFGLCASMIGIDHLPVELSGGLYLNDLGGNVGLVRSGGLEVAVEWVGVYDGVGASAS